MSDALYALRAAVTDRMRYLQNLVEGRADFEQQVDTYLEARDLLAEYFRELAVGEMEHGGPSIPLIKGEISALLRSTFAGRVPDRLLEVRGYTGVHPILLRYLSRHPNAFVRADRLRVLTGDQVHTERRVRELRDLGLTIEARKVAGQNQYRLAASFPNVVEGARYQLKKNLQGEKYPAATIAVLQTEL